MVHEVEDFGAYSQDQRAQSLNLEDHSVIYLFNLFYFRMLIVTQIILDKL